MIADMLNNKTSYLIVTEVFIRDRKVNISLVFITQSYFAVPKNIRLNSIHYFIMKIQNKRGLHQIAFNHSSDIEFKNSINLYKKYTAKPYSLLVIDTTLASNNPLRLRNNFLEKALLIMTIDVKVKHGKLQYNVNRDAAKILALSSGKIDKYEYLMGEEILPPDQRRLIKQATFTYSPLAKVFGKQIKTIENHRRKQVEALKV